MQGVNFGAPPVNDNAPVDPNARSPNAANGPAPPPPQSDHVPPASRPGPIPIRAAPPPRPNLPASRRSPRLRLHFRPHMCIVLARRLNRDPHLQNRPQQHLTMILANAGIQKNMEMTRVDRQLLMVPALPIMR